MSILMGDDDVLVCIFNCFRRNFMGMGRQLGLIIRATVYKEHLKFLILMQFLKQF